MRRRPSKDEIKPGADLVGADLSGADLRKANLKGANLWKAIIEGAKLPHH